LIVRALERVAGHFRCVKCKDPAFGLSGAVRTNDRG
jgi:hypothetical protein